MSSQQDTPLEALAKREFFLISSELELLGHSNPDILFSELKNHFSELGIVLPEPRFLYVPQRKKPEVDGLGTQFLAIPYEGADTYIGYHCSCCNRYYGRPNLREVNGVINALCQAEHEKGRENNLLYRMKLVRKKLVFIGPGPQPMPHP